MNTPLSTIRVIFTSLAMGAAGPATNATIDCKQGTTSLTPQSGATASNKLFGNGTTTLVPGTYDCQVVIDP